MFSGSGGAAARKRLIQQCEVGHLIDLRQKPVGKTTTAAAGNLPTQQLDRTIEDPVVVRFGNAILAVIGKPNHARVFDGCPEQRMGFERHPSSFWRSRPRNSQARLFLQEIGQPRMRRTEVLPIWSLRAISALATPRSEEHTS